MDNGFEDGGLNDVMDHQTINEFVGQVCEKEDMGGVCDKGVSESMGDGLVKWALIQHYL